MSEASLYVAVIGDLIGSRKLDDRAGVQERLFGTLDLLNKTFSDHIRSRFVVTVGDEFQGLLSAEAPLDRIWWMFAGEMFPDVLARFGFGLGTLSTSVREEALGMDGPSFWAAREAIDLAHGENLLLSFCLFDNDEWSIAINYSARLLNRVMTNWTSVQWKTAALYEKHGNQSVVAEKRRVARQTVNDSLASSLGIECLQSLRGLSDMFRLG